MPFNAAMVGLGGARTFQLAKLDAEDLATLYVVETQIALQFPLLAPSQPGDVIRLTLGGHVFVAALANNYCIDADGLNAGASFVLTLEAGCFIRGRGGIGGEGGFGGSPGQTDGLDGVIGGTAMRLGCPTEIFGIGTIERGYGGGGGGAGSFNPGPNIGTGGSGGGGGAPLGAGGVGGNGDDEPGFPGSIASILLGGAGGNSLIQGTDGGDGGSNGLMAQNGENSSGFTGGVGGADGDSIDTQGFDLDFELAIIPIGPII